MEVTAAAGAERTDTAYPRLLHWARAADRLRGPDVSRLVDAVQEVFADALNVGGTSFDRLYVNVSGQSGYFEGSLAVYGRAGQPCPRCGAPVRRDAFMNRSSFSCPVCQPRPPLAGRDGCRHVSCSSRRASAQNPCDAWY